MQASYHHMPRPQTARETLSHLPRVAETFNIPNANDTSRYTSNSNRPNLNSYLHSHSQNQTQTQTQRTNTTTSQQAHTQPQSKTMGIGMGTTSRDVAYGTGRVSRGYGKGFGPNGVGGYNVSRRGSKAFVELTKQYASPFEDKGQNGPEFDDQAREMDVIREDEERLGGRYEPELEYEPKERRELQGRRFRDQVQGQADAQFDSDFDYEVREVDRAVKQSERMTGDILEEYGAEMKHQMLRMEAQLSRSNEKAKVTEEVFNEYKEHRENEKTKLENRILELESRISQDQKLREKHEKLLKYVSEIANIKLENFQSNGKSELDDVEKENVKTFINRIETGMDKIELVKMAAKEKTNPEAAEKLQLLQTVTGVSVNYDENNDIDVVVANIGHESGSTSTGSTNDSSKEGTKKRKFIKFKFVKEKMEVKEDEIVQPRKYKLLTTSGEEFLPEYYKGMEIVKEQGELRKVVATIAYNINKL